MRPHIVRYLILLPVLLLPFGSAQAGHPAHDILMRISHAARALNYEGIFVYEHGEQLEAMRIVHLVKNGSVRERLLSLNGTPREIVRTDEEVTCYLPDEKSVVVEYRKTSKKSFPDLFIRNLHGIDSNYSIKVGKKGRVAGRTVQSVIILPRDKYRYGYELWADDETGLLLKADLLNDKQEAIEQFMFTQVNIDQHIDPALVEAQTDSDDLVWHREEGEPVIMDADGSWRVTRLPRGFALSKRMKRKVPTRKIPVEHLVYTDGLAAVSVFIERKNRGGKPSINGLSRMGAVHAYGTVVADHQITVVGEVPAATVALVASSITLK